MSKVTKHIPVSVLIFILLSCSAFPSGRVEEPPGKQEARIFWILDGSMSAESAEMFLERYLFPTSLAAMFWTEFSVQGNEVRFDTKGGYRIVRKQRVLTESLGAYTVYGYDLIIEMTWPAEARPAESAPDSRSRKTYEVRFSYPESADSASGIRPSGVLPQPLEQALLAGIGEDGRSSGNARVDQVEYLGSGRFRATVLVGD
jgi:hypothetical protein